MPWQQLQRCAWAWQLEQAGAWSWCQASPPCTLWEPPHTAWHSGKWGQSQGTEPALSVEGKEIKKASHVGTPENTNSCLYYFTCSLTTGALYTWVYRNIWIKNIQHRQNTTCSIKFKTLSTNISVIRFYITLKNRENHDITPFGITYNLIIFAILYGTIWNKNHWPWAFITLYRQSYVPVLTALGSYGRRWLLWGQEPPPAEHQCVKTPLGSSSSALRSADPSPTITQTWHIEMKDMRQH